MLEKIAKLLAKAEAASTQEEAETYFAKAQELATLHQISLAEASLVKGKQSSTLTHRTITIGESGKQVNSHLVWLFNTIANYNSVQINIAHNSTFVIAFGFSDDIDTVELLWSRIAPVMIRLGEQFLDQGTWREETSYRVKKIKQVETGWNGRTYTYYDEQWGEWPITKQAARASFYQGFRNALGRRLDAQRRETVEKVQQAHDEAQDGISTDLVLTAKKDAVSAYYQKTSTARGSYKGGSSSGYSRSSAAAGREAGSRVSLGGGGAIGGKKVLG